MTLQGSQRRGFRRRMLQSGGSGNAPAPAADVSSARPRTSAYSKEARPEHHPALGTWLPTRMLPLVGIFFAVAIPIAGIVTAAFMLDKVLAAGIGGESPWAASAGQLRACLSLAPRAGLAAWMGQAVLVAAACVAVSVRQMRRYRLDDYRGRYRAWGWLAGLAVAATIERQLPIASLVSAAMADATGVQFGPGSVGWWLCLSVPACVAVGLWAMLPLFERLLPSAVLATAGLTWISATACAWLASAGDSETLALAAGGLTLAGDGLLFMAMLVASRSVLREVRGEASSTERAPKRDNPTRRDEARGHSHPTHADNDVSRDDDEPAHEAARWSDGSEGADDDEDADEGWAGGSDRKLSKAEKKRLRKLARMNRAA